jgi:hypothetical protein
MLFALAACGDDKPGVLPELRIVQPSVPAHLLSCEDEPADPADKPDLTQRDVARYLVLLRAAGADCRAKLGEVKGLVKADTAAGRETRAGGTVPAQR